MRSGARSAPRVGDRPVVARWWVPVGWLVGAVLVGLLIGVVAGSSPASAASAGAPTVGGVTESPSPDHGSAAPPTPIGGNDSLRSGDDHRRCPAAAGRSSGPAAAGSNRSDGEPEPPPKPRIVELYPNPLTEGNVGEYFVLAVPDGTSLENWTVSDGHATAAFPNRTVTGRVAVSTDPEATRNLTSDPVLALEGHLPLAADGDDLEIRNAGEAVDRVSYERAPLGEVWYRVRANGPGARGDAGSTIVDDGRGAGESGEAPPNGERDAERSDSVSDGTWWPRHGTCRPVTSAAVDEATAFVLPDSPESVRETLRSAEDRVLLAGYTFTSEAVAADLERAAARGVEVRVLIEGGPVGGASAATARVLDDLAETNATVRAIGGRGARYAYHHAKYAVVDDRAIVTTENWKPSGVGGAGSRGWGAVVTDDAIAAELARVFAADFGGRDTRPWTEYKRTASFTEADPGSGEFDAQFAPDVVDVDAVEVLVAPDNAQGRLRELLRSADESIRVEQVRIGGREFPPLVDLLEAARRGVEVRVLLDASWYVESENRELAQWLERTAEAEDLPLSVKLVEPRGRFEKIHAKGVVIDGETVVVGSANWNRNSLRENREVVFVLHGKAVGDYYASVFDDDWAGGAWPLPVGLVGAIAVALVGGGLVGRRALEFGGARDGRPATEPVVASHLAPTAVEGDPATGSGRRVSSTLL